MDLTLQSVVSPWASSTRYLGTREMQTLSLYPSPTELEHVCQQAVLTHIKVRKALV